MKVQINPTALNSLKTVSNFCLVENVISNAFNDTYKLRSLGVQAYKMKESGKSNGEIVEFIQMNIFKANTEAKEFFNTIVSEIPEKFHSCTMYHNFDLKRFLSLEWDSLSYEYVNRFNNFYKN